MKLVFSSTSDSSKMALYISRTQHLVLITWLAVFAAFALVGIRDFLVNIEDNRCEMTYMYEWPRYIRVPLWKGTSKRFPRYALHLYGEGDYADRSSNLKLTGIPVLFIPGNAGSYKQVRSLASVALRKAESLRSRVHFNYFTADLDESLSGLYGGVLKEQTEFVRLCITRIVWLYRKTSNPPKSVVLIGHSMGGLIARGLFAMRNFSTHLVHTIITLGTPHQHPVVSLDPQLADYYENINSFWKSQTFINENESRLKNITLVSVSGGFRDVLVRSSPSSLKQIARPSQTISVVTSSVPRAWVSVDHLCLCWCRQLVLITNRALFDMIDQEKRQIMESKQHRVKIFTHHFLKNSGQSIVTLDQTGKVKSRMDKYFNPVVLHKRLWRFKGTGKNLNEQKLFAFSLDEWTATHNFLIIMTSVESESWLLGCQKTSGQACSTVSDLTHLAKLLPWNGTAMKFVKLDLANFAEMEYLAVHVPPSTRSNIVWSEFHSSDSSVYSVQLPGLFARKSTVLDIPSDTIFANISIKSVAKAWKVFVFYVEAMDCDNRNSLLIGRIHVPWFNEDKYSFSSNGHANLVLKLNHPKPRATREHVQIHLWLDPKCSHRVSAQFDFYQTLGQIYRFYYVQLPCWAFSVVMLVIAWQLSSMNNEQRCDSFFSLVANAAKSLRVLLLVFQSHFFVSQLVLAYFVWKGDIGQHSWLPNIDDLKTFIWLIPLVLIISTAVIIVITLFVWVGMFARLGGFILGRFKVLPQTPTKFGIKDWIFMVAEVVTAFLFCGTLALVLIFLVCLWKTWKYAAIVKALSKKEQVQQKDKRLMELLESFGNFYLTLCVLTLLVISINIPALAVWAKNISLSFHLSADHTSLFSVVISINITLFDPLIVVPRSLVYLCFMLSIAVAQAPALPLYLIPYTICFLLTVLNVSHYVYSTKSERFKED